MHIAVSGNIGSGKTLLVEKVCQELGWTPQYIDSDKNPYLENFYANMPEWSFHLQVFFLQSRFKQITEIRKSNQVVIQDRTIYEDACIFAPNLLDLGVMKQIDYNTYLELFQLIDSLVQSPDLLIFLRASVPTLLKQIQMRGRTYEAGIRTEYLAKLNERYEKWFDSYPGNKVVIDIDQNDFSQDPDAFYRVLNSIQMALPK